MTRSWDLVADKTEKVGVDFFLRLFQEHPQAADLFKFGGAVVDNLGKNEARQEVKVRAALRVHAKKVMETVGVCVAGLTHLPDLVPTLRSLGRMHSSLGVQGFHYDAVYHHLMDAIEAEVGPETFDSQTREAWEIVYRSLTQVMKNPNNVLQMEPLEGWGTVATASCAYLTIVTPLQMASLTVGNSQLNAQITYLTIVAAIVLALDMSSHWIAEQVRPKGYAPDLSKRSPLRREVDRWIFPIKFRATRFIRSLQMDRWVPWQKMEATVLLSFPLQYAHYLFYSEAASPSSVGVHWTYAFGLLRLVAAHRVFHALTCAENNFLLRRHKISTQELSTIRMAKLIGTMLLVIHVNACLWCVVARVGIGPGNDPVPTAFFPKPQEIFQGHLSALNAYLHAVHWAWVSLAGIGDCDSTPETSLECLATLFVHICGATLYTITTGNVVNILEAMSAKRNEVTGDLAELGHFMQSCNVPQDTQKRILQGYMMKKMIGDGDGFHDNGMGNAAPTSPEAVSRLPRHLEAEMFLYIRAEGIKRRDPAFAYCSLDFLVAFVGALKEHIVVLSEEDYVHEGQSLPEQVALLVEGRMRVMVNGVCVRYLEAGDLIGKHQLFLDHVTGTPEKVGLQAETTCTLKAGLSDHGEVEVLQERYAKDFSLLSAHRLGKVPAEATMNDLTMNDLSYMNHTLPPSGRRSSAPRGAMNDLSWLGSSISSSYRGRRSSVS